MFPECGVCSYQIKIIKKKPLLQHCACVRGDKPKNLQTTEYGRGGMAQRECKTCHGRFDCPKYAYICRFEKWKMSYKINDGLPKTKENLCVRRHDKRSKEREMTAVEWDSTFHSMLGNNWKQTKKRASKYGYCRYTVSVSSM